MICKETKMRSPGASRLGGVARYITNDQGNPLRVSAVRVYGSETADPDAPDGGAEGAAFEFEMAQRTSGTAAKAKTAHLVLSLGQGEDMTDERLFALQEELMEKMGWGNAQRIVAIHRDTDTLHAHIALNCILPDTGNKINTSFSKLRLRKACEELEREHGLTLTGDNAAGEQKRGRSAGASADMEAMTGQQSAASYIKDNLADKIAAATSWSAVHAECAAFGVRIEAKGQGLVFVTKDGIGVKASAISRDFSKGKLEKRLGVFTEAPTWQQFINAKEEYEKKPLVTPKTEGRRLWDEFVAGKTENATVVYEEIRKTAARKKQEKEAAWAAYRRKTAALARTPKSARAESMEQAHAEYEAQKQEIQDRYEAIFAALKRRKAKSSWVEWLRANAENGDRDCLAELRNRAMKLARNNLISRGAGAPGDRRDEFVDVGRIFKVTRRGMVLYKYNESIVKDFGDMISCSGRDKEAARMTLEIANARFKSPLTLTGSKEWQDMAVRVAAECNLKLTFADPELEKRRQELVAKLHPTPMKKQQPKERGRGGGGMQI